MAYTYDDFLSYLPQAGLTESNFSAEDLALAKSNPQAGVMLLDAKFDYVNAATDDQRALANAKANQIRSQYGYDGGIDGVNGNASLTPDDLPGYIGNSLQSSFQSSAVPAGTGTQAPVYQATGGLTPSSFTPQAAPAPFSYDKAAPVYTPGADYVNKYSGTQQQLIGDIAGYRPFEFDKDSSPLYSSYAKQYSREGQRAMQDTLGSLAAATGGIPSSYAASAAGQANDYYMSRLGDKIPEIYEQEYNKYLGDFNMLQQKLGAVNNQEGIDYSRYWDGKNFDWNRYLSDLGQYNTDRGQAFDAYQSGLNQYNRDRDFGYGQFYDDLNFKTNADQTQYNRSRDLIGDMRYADETAYGREQDAKKWEQKDKENQWYIDEMNASAETAKWNRMTDLFKASGEISSGEMADYFGLPIGTRYGGTAAELALEQQRADIANTKARTANTGR